MKVAVLDGRDFDVSVLKDDSNSGIVTPEQLVRRNGVGSVAYSDFRTDREKFQQSLHACRRARGAVNVHDGLETGIIHRRHQPSQSARMVAVGMRDENVIDIAKVRAQPCKTPCNTLTCIYDILSTIDDKQV